VEQSALYALADDYEAMIWHVQPGYSTQWPSSWRPEPESFRPRK